jgi:transcription initiation factor TFIID subunit 12
MLMLADEFVDNVITAACRIAKLRESATLDIRDIQLILERNYNIRVPVGTPHVSDGISC